MTDLDAKHTSDLKKLAERAAKRILSLPEVHVDCGGAVDAFAEIISEEYRRALAEQAEGKP